MNESEVTHKQLEHLGRSPGNPIFVVAQKSLTGHPKGAAASWMMNGLMQIIQTGRVPGNANADDIDVNLRKFTYVTVMHVAVRIAPALSARMDHRCSLFASPLHPPPSRVHTQQLAVHEPRDSDDGG